MLLACLLLLAADLTASSRPREGGSCPSNAPLLCDNVYCCPQDYPYCCPGQACGAESTCGGGGGGCDPGEASCDDGCCPVGSVCGTPGTGTCCPESTPYHCASQGTCSADPSDPCGTGGGGDTGTDPTGGGGGTCDAGDTPCDDGCCPSGSVCGTPGTGTCCPVEAPYHCAAEGTCSPDPNACGGGDGDGGSCPGDASGYPGLPADIQIWSQCAGACSYCGVGNQEGVDATCSILAGWDPSYPGQCSWCSQDCSTPSGDQGDPASVSTDNDDSAGLCTVGGSGTPWSTALLVVLLGLRRRRSAS